MSDRPLTIWQRIREWLLHKLMFSGEWSLMPVHEEDMPGVWVSMNSPEYQTLILFGYPHPEGQEVDWSLEHDLSATELVDLFNAAILVAQGRSST